MINPNLTQQFYNLPQQQAVAGGGQTVGGLSQFMQYPNTMQTINNPSQQLKLEFNFTNITSQNPTQSQTQLAANINTSIPYTTNATMFNMPQSYVDPSSMFTQMQMPSQYLVTPMNVSIPLQQQQQLQQQQLFQQQLQNQLAAQSNGMANVNPTATLQYSGMIPTTTQYMNAYGFNIPSQQQAQLQLLNQQNQQQQQVQQQQQQQQAYNQLFNKQQQLSQFGMTQATPVNQSQLNGFSYATNPQATAGTSQLLMQTPNSLNQVNFSQLNGNTLIADQYNMAQGLSSLQNSNNIMTQLGMNTQQMQTTPQMLSNTQAAMVNYQNHLQQIDQNNNSMGMNNIQQDLKQNLINNSLQVKQISHDSQSNPQLLQQQQQQQLQQQIQLQRLQNLNQNVVDVSSEDNQYSNQQNNNVNLQKNNEAAFNKLLRNQKKENQNIDSPNVQENNFNGNRSQLNEIVIDDESNNQTDENMQKKQDYYKQLINQHSSQSQRVVIQQSIPKRENLIDLKIRKNDLQNFNSNSNSQQFSQSNSKFANNKNKPITTSSKYNPMRVDRDSSQSSQNISLLKQSKRISKDKQSSNNNLSNSSVKNNNNTNNSTNANNSNNTTITTSLKLVPAKQSEFLEQETLKNKAIKQQYELFRQESSQSQGRSTNNTYQNQNGGYVQSQYSKISKKDSTLDDDFSEENRSQKMVRQSKRIQDKSKNDENSNQEVTLNQSPQTTPQINVSSQNQQSSNQQQSSKEGTSNQLDEKKSYKLKKETPLPLICKKCSNKCTKGQFLSEKQICRKCDAILAREKKETQAPPKAFNVNDFWALKLQKNKISIGHQYQADVPPYQLHETSYLELNKNEDKIPNRTEHFQTIMNNRVYQGSIDSSKYTIIYDKICKQIDKFTYSDMNMLLQRYCFNLDDVLDKLNMKDENLAEIIRQLSNYKSNTRMTRQQMQKKFQY